MEALSLTAWVDLREGSNFNLSEHGHVAYQIKENHEGSNYVAIILPADLPLPQTLGMRSVDQNSTFSEHVNVAYQINENQECSHMVANIRVGSIDLNSTFSEHGLVAYQIKENHKLKRITNAATW